jgi:hypothetical protein
VVREELAAAAAMAAPAYAVDESVLSILREEAEREAKARRAESRSRWNPRPTLASMPPARAESRRGKRGPEPRR